MFETEVYFASELLNKDTSRGPGLVLYDELFHSTNPPDGTRTAAKFLERLWAKQGFVSIVSTHVFELVEAAPTQVQRIQCMATVLPDGEIDYLYNVKEGVCKVSSVQSIWKRFGL
jgi:DNA mismatch repair ATPase MutS